MHVKKKDVKEQIVPHLPPSADINEVTQKVLKTSANHTSSSQ